MRVLFAQQSILANRFLVHETIYIIALQEVTSFDLNIPNYEVIVNINSVTSTGCAMSVSSDIPYSNVFMHSFGRIIAVQVRSMQVFCVYIL